MPNSHPIPGPQCTCTVEIEYYDGGASQPVLTEPNPYCPVDFPQNHALREEKARSGYEKRRAAIDAVNPWLASDRSSWDRLPEGGKNIWRTWAEAEFWGGGYDDGAAGTDIEVIEEPPPFSLGKTESF